MGKFKGPRKGGKTSAAGVHAQRHLIVQPQFLEDLQHWISEDPKVAERLLRLADDCRKTPFQGIGKPEPLKGEFAGCWSRRLTDEDRFVYRVTHDAIDCLQARYHY